MAQQMRCNQHGQPIRWVCYSQQCRSKELLLCPACLDVDSHSTMGLLKVFQRQEKYANALLHQTSFYPHQQSNSLQSLIQSQLLSAFQTFRNCFQFQRPLKDEKTRERIPDRTWLQNFARHIHLKRILECEKQQMSESQILEKLNQIGPVIAERIKQFLQRISKDLTLVIQKFKKKLIQMSGNQWNIQVQESQVRRTQSSSREYGRVQSSMQSPSAPIFGIPPYYHLSHPFGFPPTMAYMNQPTSVQPQSEKLIQQQKREQKPLYVQQTNQGKYDKFDQQPADKGSELQKMQARHPKVDKKKQISQLQGSIFKKYQEKERPSIDTLSLITLMNLPCENTFNSKSKSQKIALNSLRNIAYVIQSTENYLFVLGSQHYTEQLNSRIVKIQSCEPRSQILIGTCIPQIVSRQNFRDAIGYQKGTFLVQGCPSLGSLSFHSHQFKKSMKYDGFTFQKGVFVQVKLDYKKSSFQFCIIKPFIKHLGSMYYKSQSPSQKIVLVVGFKGPASTKLIDKEKIN